jgi:hypothetical protein
MPKSSFLSKPKTAISQFRPRKEKGVKFPVFEYQYVENADKLSKAYAILFEAIAKKIGNKP